MLIGSGVQIGNGVDIYTTMVAAQIYTTSAQIFEVGVATNSFTPLFAVPGTGTAPYTYTIISGTLPTGLAFDSSTGTVYGTPTDSYGTNNIVFGVIDANGFTAQTTATVTYTVYVRISATAYTTPQYLEVGVVVTPYSPLIAINGTGAYTYSNVGAIPAGLTYSFLTGRLSGIPTVASNATSTFSVQDSYNAVATTTSTVNFTVYSAITATATTTAQITEVGIATSFTPLRATGGSGTYIYYVVSGNLPPGLTLNSSTGLVSGTPAASYSTATVIFGVRDSAGGQAAATSSVSYTTYSLITATANTTAQTMEAGVQISAFTPLVAAGGSGSYIYSVLGAPPLPAGLTYNSSTGLLSGTPTLGLGAITLTFTVADTVGGVATTTSAVNINIYPALTTTASATTVQNLDILIPMVSFNPLTATGGTGAYTYYVGVGILPAGITLNPTTGLLSGTPTTIYSTSPVTIKVRDSFVVSSTASTINFSVNPTISAVATNSVSQNYEVGTTIVSFYPLVAIGGAQPYTYTASTLLPDGLSLNSTTGLISGTPTTPTSSTNIGFTVTDSLGQTASTTVNITFTVFAVITATANNTTTRLFTPNQVITPFNPLTAANGSGLYTYSVSDGSLPAGISLNTSTGSISGTPTVTGTSTFTISVKDSINVVAATTSGIQTVYIASPITATANPTTTQNLEVGVTTTSFTPLTATGGTGTYTYYISSGGLPPGLSLNPTTGAVTGIPSVDTVGTGGVYLVFAVKDSLNNIASTVAGVSYYVYAHITATSANSVAILTVGKSYSYSYPLLAANGTGSYTYYVSSGTFPGGISINSSTGVVSGTPTSTYSTANVVISVKDSSNVVATTTGTISFTVYNTITATASGTPYGAGTIQIFDQNSTISPFYPLVASGGSGSYTYSLSASTLPTGLTLNSTTGAVSGTPTTAGSVIVTFIVTDNITGISADNNNTVYFTIYSAMTATAISTAQSYIIGTAITAYNPLTASGGSGTYTYSYTGTIPTGLTYNASTGVLSGTPTVIQSMSATFSVKDNLNIVAATTSTVSFNTGLGPVIVNYLVIAGGGAGGYGGPPGSTAGGGGGGGGGGYINGSYTQNPGTVLTITVGGGGSSSYGQGGSGNPSSLTGATTASGGGGGGGWTPTLSTQGAGAGGSGGGGSPSYAPTYPSYSGYSPGSGGSGSQGNPGGSSGASPGGPPFPNQAYGGGGGGGGGAGGTGGNGAIGPSLSFNAGWTGAGGAGGAGRTWSFTGATLYAGGGGGGGGNYLAPGNPGPSSYGYGGSGGGQPSGSGVQGSSGGSGVVILSVPTGLYSGIKTGGVTSTPPAAPGQTVITYTSSGTYRA